jgi:hypothetical protein
MTTTLIPFDVQAQKIAAAKLLESSSLATMQIAAEHLQVVDEESYTMAVDLRNRFASAEKKIMDFWEGFAKAANALHKSLTGARSEMAEPYVAGKNLCESKARDYLRSQEAEKRRQEAELRRLANQEQAKLQKKADDLMDRGYIAEAEKVQQRATMTVAPKLESAIPQVSGVKVSKKFKARVVDVTAVMNAILTGTIPLMYEVKPGDSRTLVAVDQVVLNALVNRQLDSLNIPGVVVEEDFGISRSGR